MMSQYHPGKLTGQGVPEDMIAIAIEQAKEVQIDYDLIKKIGIRIVQRLNEIRFSLKNEMACGAHAASSSAKKWLIKLGKKSLQAL